MKVAKNSFLDAIVRVVPSVSTSVLSRDDKEVASDIYGLVILVATPGSLFPSSQNISSSCLCVTSFCCREAPPPFYYDNRVGGLVHHSVDGI